jgi:2',3'-cyclic-nucleotide 2'-phosphodiesterase (5'-nucleotidase family)
MEGRFLQMSGVTFAFDPTKPAGSRIVSDSVKVQDEELKLEKLYVVATSDYIAAGKDGFNCIEGCKELIDHENAPLLKDIVLDFFGNFL